MGRTDARRGDGLAGGGTRRHARRGLRARDLRAGAVAWRSARSTASRIPPSIDRGVYFRELLRLQAELVKLQDWVQHHQGEGRGALRGPRQRRQGRRDQAHHPAAQSARLPRRRAAGANDRERTQWYFQRYVPHLPAAARWCCSTGPGTIAPASSASWASPRRRRSRTSSATCPSSSACWCAPASSW